ATGAALLPVALFSSQVSEAWLGTDAAVFAKNRYVGAKACKSCHKAEAKGAAFTKWAAGQHAKAWETLGTAAAKKVGEKEGVKDPQTSPKCLKCHVTAHGVEKKKIKRGFKVKAGVQCESCHGPGEKHAKARFKAAMGKVAEGRAVLPAGEINARPELKVCLDCHNDKSPTFKPFCLKMRLAKIEHLDPRIKRTKEELEARKCQCKECKCKQAECGCCGDAKGGEKKTGKTEKKTEKSAKEANTGKTGKDA
ncbi:MAG: multiheme c-type cytochrome, partial [Planctomycetota bacterium]